MNIIYSGGTVKQLPSIHHAPIILLNEKAIEVSYNKQDIIELLNLNIIKLIRHLLSIRKELT